MHTLAQRLMARPPKNNALFAILFSDLMMGAMGVIIVLLVFLQVVANRGSGSADGEQRLSLPAGLDLEAYPLVRVRIEYCSTDKGDALLDWSGSDNDVSKYKMVQGDCIYRIFHFQDGLNRRTLSFKSTADTDNAEVSIQLTIAGYLISKKRFRMDPASKPLIAEVNLGKKEVIYIP